MQCIQPHAQPGIHRSALCTSFCFPNGGATLRLSLIGPRVCLTKCRGVQTTSAQHSEDAQNVAGQLENPTGYKRSSDARGQEPQVPARGPDVWDSKPSWCQPWTILLTGGTILAGTWRISAENPWVTGAVGLPICAWWYLFLIVMPESYAEYVRQLASERSNADDILSGGD